MDDLILIKTCGCTAEQIELTDVDVDEHGWLELPNTVCMKCFQTVRCEVRKKTREPDIKILGAD